MSEDIKFSIIVPIYKVEKYLIQCVDSLINQTYKNIEIILVDDGSPDNCPNICDEYAKKDSRVVVVHKENGGLVSARKAGAEIATGDYCVSVDGDDWVTTDYIQEMYNILLKHPVDMIYANAFLSYNDNNVDDKMYRDYRLGYYNEEELKKEIFPSLLQRYDATYIHTTICIKVFKRDLYLQQQSKVDSRIKIGEDRACVIPYIYNSKSIFITDKIVYYYRQNSASITKNRKPFSFEGLALFAEHIKTNVNLSEYDFLEQYYRLIEHEFFNVAVSQFYKKDKYRNVKKEIKQKMNEEPFKDVLGKAKFKGSKKAWLMHFALKHKIFWLMKLYSKIK